jgi:tRNA modification GTPase
LKYASGRWRGKHQIMDPATIAAIATPGGRGSIGIIKMSGPDAAKIAAGIFNEPGLAAKRPKPGMVSHRFESHRFNYGYIFDPDQQRRVDEVLMVYMAAPRTYTREDVVEIHAHGGPVVLRRILELVLRRGARLAEPGEFTRRAFLNGRIDLTQAEAVCDLIYAETDSLLHAATHHVQGQLRNEVDSIRQQLIELQTRVEAAIDFPEDVEEVLDVSAWTRRVEQKVLAPLGRLIQFHRDAGVIREGLRLAVVGRPNVGKSSLLNRLLKKERVIVTATPGTTRDVIEESLSIQGIPIRVADTAGLHTTQDPLEKMGVDKTLEHIAGSDGVLFMVEAQQAPGPADEEIYRRIREKPLVVTVNKIDLVHGDPFQKIPPHWRQHPRAAISALSGEGIEELMDQMGKICLGDVTDDFQTDIIPNVRHRCLLEQGLQASRAVLEGLQAQRPVELISIHLREGIDALGEVLGVGARADILENIFSRFCIGK